jgi:hypothetical protein
VDHEQQGVAAGSASWDADGLPLPVAGEARALLRRQLLGRRLVVAAGAAAGEEEEEEDDEEAAEAEDDELGEDDPALGEDDSAHICPNSSTRSQAVIYT